MLKKTLIILSILVLCFSAIGVAGCQNSGSDNTKKEADESSNEESGKQEEVEEKDSKKDNRNIPAIFENFGIGIQEGEVDESGRFVDEEDHGEVAINSEESAERVADDLESQLKDCGAKNIVRNDSEDGKISEISASVSADGKRQFDFYTAIEEQDSKTNIYYMIQDHEERLQDLQGN